MPRLKLPYWFWCLPASIVLAGPAAAQAPSVGFIFPPGVQAGTKATVTVNGGNLQGATGILLSGDGVKANITNNSGGGSLPVEVEVASTAPPGLHEVRIVTPRGTSNAGEIWVGGYPGTNETEPNNTVGAANKLDKLPVTVNGQVNGGEDADYFTFQAGAGDTYVFDLVAYRMNSALDGYLALFDAKGKVLKSAQEPFDRDPRLVYTFKDAGTYSVQVRDTMYRGGGNFTYLLTLGKLPVITSYLPRAGKRGQTVMVKVEGANLGSMTTVPVQMPAEGDRVQMVPPTPAGPAVNPISLTASDLDELVETEPNDTAAQATALPGTPVAVSGRIDRRGDVDVYRIRPAAAGNLVFEVFARRLGARIDSSLRVMDPTGKVLSSNDDADGKDSRTTMGVQANTEYLVEITTLDQNFGGDAFYRLEIDPPTGQDFRLSVSPDAINVGQGGATAVTVTVQRINGFAGPIELRVDGLPQGLTASPGLIPAGAPSAQFTVTADPAAAQGAMSQIRVFGKGKIGDKDVEKAAQPTEGYKVPLAPDPQPGQPVPQRPTEIMTATAAPPTPYALTVAPDQRVISVKRGTSVMIKVTAIRQMGQNAAINLTVAGQPANVNPALQNIAEKANEATITLNVAANAPLVRQNVIITGTMNNATQVAPAITLTITE